MSSCKPRIRQRAQIGDVVVAFASARLPSSDGHSWGRHDLVWAGVVQESMPLAAYWNDVRFDGKKPHNSSTPDNIYIPDGQSFRQVDNDWHGTDSITRDTGGKSVLVMNPAWRFAPADREAPEQMTLGGSPLRMDLFNRRGHRVCAISEEEKKTLTAWLAGKE